MQRGKEESTGINIKIGEEEVPKKGDYQLVSQNSENHSKTNGTTRRKVRGKSKIWTLIIISVSLFVTKFANIVERAKHVRYTRLLQFLQNKELGYPVRKS